MIETADIVVVGGGCIGASIALHLAEREAGKVLLLEQKDLANGASGKGVGIIRTHYSHPVLAELALMSLRLFHNFSERFGGQEAGFHPCGYYVLVGESDVATLQQLVSLHQSLGINVRFSNQAELLAVMPGLNLEDVGAIAHEPDSGYGSPPQTTRAFAARAVELGVDVRCNAPVTDILRDAEGRICAVRTPTGEISTRMVIDCVGPWAKKFTEPLGLPFPVQPVIEHVVVVERPAEHRVVHPVISDLINLCYFRSDPHQPCTRAGNSDPRYHSQYTVDDADEFHGQQFPEFCDDLYRKLTKRFVALVGASVSETYTGIWAKTPDYQPIIDRLEHVPGLYCAVGFSGHGYKLSPIIGDLFSRRILGLEDDKTVLLDLFRSDRFQRNQLIRSPLTYANASGVR
jgi:sarcosine oxidase subunit beta